MGMSIYAVIIQEYVSRENNFDLRLNNGVYWKAAY